MSANTVVWITDQRGAGLKVSVSPTPEAEEAAVAFLTRTTHWEVGQTDYRVATPHEVADGATSAILDFLFPQCEHGMSLALCMGPMHYPSAQQEMEMFG